jgi:hypothetical protein
MEPGDHISPERLNSPPTNPPYHRPSAHSPGAIPFGESVYSIARRRLLPSDMPILQDIKDACAAHLVYIKTKQPLANITLNKK